MNPVVALNENCLSGTFPGQTYIMLVPAVPRFQNIGLPMMCPDVPPGAIWSSCTALVSPAALKPPMVSLLMR